MKKKVPLGRQPIPWALTIHLSVGRTLKNALLGCAAVVGIHPTTTAAQTVSAETSEIGELREIVVTATRRAENLSRVPESIDVFTSADIDARGIRSAADLIAQAPGVDLQTQLGIQTNISIRGISNSVGQQSTGAATAGIYIDDTPVQIRSIGNGAGDPLPDIFDLDRVEVLRGPQGTLFGSGSEGGAIRFISTQPSLSSWSSYDRAELYQTERGGASYEVLAAEGGPIVENSLGFRISAHYWHQGGFVDRVPTPEGAGPDPVDYNANYSNTVSVHGALLWAPVENLQITPSIYFRQTNLNDIGQYWLRLSNPSSESYVSGNGQATPDRNQSTLQNLKVNWTLGPMELISNTGYYNRNQSNLQDYRALLTNTFYGGQNPTLIFATPGYYDNGLISNKQNDWTQELRLQSTNREAKLTWVAGLFYENNRQFNFQNLRTPFFDLEAGIPNASVAIFGLPLLDGQYLYQEQIVTRDIQYAAFGDLTFQLTSRFKLTAGFRIARSETQYIDSEDGPLPGGPGEHAGKHLETPKTPRYVAAFQLDPHTMFYASMSDGYRIGGVNPSVPVNAACTGDLTALGLQSAPLTYNSDRVRSYELGVKSQAFNDSLQLFSSVYYINWKNVIQPVDLVSCGIAFTTNLGRAVSKGVDLQVNVAPVSSLLMSLQVGYDDAKYAQTVSLPGATSNLVTNGWTLGQTPWTIVVSGNYKFRGPVGLDSYFRTDATLHTRNPGLTTNTDPSSANYDPFLRSNPATLDVRLRLGAKIGRWDTSAFVNNASNEHPILNRNDDSPGGFIQYATPVEPRTFGVTVESRF